MACNWLMMTSSGDNNGRVGVWVCSPTKLKQIPKIPKAEQETAQPTAARFKKETLVKLEPRPPTAALLTRKIADLNRAFKFFLFQSQHYSRNALHFPKESLMIICLL